MLLCAGSAFFAMSFYYNQTNCRSAQKMFFLYVGLAKHQHWANTCIVPSYCKICTSRIPKGPESKGHFLSKLHNTSTGKVCFSLWTSSGPQVLVNLRRKPHKQKGDRAALSVMKGKWPWHSLPRRCILVQRVLVQTWRSGALASVACNLL